MFNNHPLNTNPFNSILGLTILPTYNFFFTVLLPILLGIAFAVYVFKDAENNKSRPLNIPPIVWSLLVLTSPSLGLIAYWLINKANFTKE